MRNNHGSNYTQSFMSGIVNYFNQSRPSIGLPEDNPTRNGVVMGNMSSTTDSILTNNIFKGGLPMRDLEVENYITRITAQTGLSKHKSQLTMFLPPVQPHSTTASNFKGSIFTRIGFENHPDYRKAKPLEEIEDFNLRKKNINQKL